MKRFIPYFAVIVSVLLVVFVFCATFSIASSIEENKKTTSETTLKIETRKLRLVDFNAPKHVYASLIDMETGDYFGHVYISKHCNSWRENVLIGKEYDIKVETIRQITYQKDFSPQTNIVKRVERLYNIFCR